MYFIRSDRIRPRHDNLRLEILSEPRTLSRSGSNPVKQTSSHVGMISKTIDILVRVVLIIILIFLCRHCIETLFLYDNTVNTYLFVHASR